MEIEYREATPKDAGLLIDIYNASFVSGKVLASIIDRSDRLH